MSSKNGVPAASVALASDMYDFCVACIAYGMHAGVQLGYLSDEGEAAACRYVPKPGSGFAGIRDFSEACVRHGLREAIRRGLVRDAGEAATPRFVVTARGRDLVNKFRRGHLDAARRMFH